MPQPERASFSPSGQSVPRRGFIERYALNRINSLTLQLPTGPFDGHNKKETVSVDGRQSLHHTFFNIRHEISQTGDDPVERLTKVTIDRDPKKLTVITGLEVDESEYDDFAEHHGIDRSHKTFSLYASHNELSAWSIMQSTVEAVKAVRYARMAATAMNPEYP